MFAALAKRISPITQRFSPLVEILKSWGRAPRKEHCAWQAIVEGPAPALLEKDPAAELLAALNDYQVQFERLVAEGVITVQVADGVRAINFGRGDEEFVKAVDEARLVEAFLKQACIESTASPDEVAQAAMGIPLDFYTQTLRGSIEVMRRQ